MNRRQFLKNVFGVAVGLVVVPSVVEAEPVPMTATEDIKAGDAVKFSYIDSEGREISEPVPVKGDVVEEDIYCEKLASGLFPYLFI